MSSCIIFCSCHVWIGMRGSFEEPCCQLTCVLEEGTGEGRPPPTDFFTADNGGLAVADVTRHPLWVRQVVS